jgi:hypothetical protein
VPITALYFGEITNFFMHMRVFLRWLGLRHTKLYAYNEQAFICLYIFMRCFAILPYVSEFIWLGQINLLIRISGVGLVVQSWGYALIMAQMSFKRFGEWRERRQRGVKLWWFSQNPKVKELSYVR